MSLKQKNIVLLIGFVLLLWLTYQFSIAKIFEAKNEYNTLLNQKELLSNVPEQINYLKQQNEYFDTILEKNKISIESSFQNNLLQFINNYATDNQLKLVAFNEPHQFVENDAILKTYSFTVKGNYASILKLIHKIEQRGNFGKLISINFEKKKNYKTDKVNLECKIYLQKINQKTK